MTSARLRSILFLLLLAASLSGCGTPAAVRNLSREQLQTQQAFATSLRTYFDVMARFAEAQRHVAHLQIEELTKEIEQRYKLRAVQRLNNATDSLARQQILDEFAKQMRDELATSADQKSQVEALVGKLKEKQHALQATYETIVDAQRKLDEYIQLQKADEVIVSQLAGTVGLHRERLNNLAVEVGTIVNSLQNLRSQVR